MVRAHAQDAPYWNMFGDMAAAVWIPLDDVHDSNGTMRVLPGYHTQGTLPRVVDPSQPAFTQSIDDAVMPADLEQRAQTCTPTPRPTQTAGQNHSSPADPLRAVRQTTCGRGRWLCVRSHPAARFGS